MFDHVTDIFESDLDKGRPCLERRGAEDRRWHRKLCEDQSAPRGQGSNDSTYALDKK